MAHLVNESKFNCVQRKELDEKSAIKKLEVGGRKARRDYFARGLHSDPADRVGCFLLPRCCVVWCCWRERFWGLPIFLGRVDVV